MPFSTNQLDERTFETLFRSNFSGLCRFAKGYVKNEGAAREIAQDAFVSLWEKRDSIDLTKQVKSYLSVTVRNKCLNYLRDHKKFSSDLLALEDLPGEALFDQPDKMVEMEIRIRIDQAIDELPEKCREIFRLNRFGNMKYKEVAEHLGISVKTVETQMSKALQHMRIRLAEYLPLAFMVALAHYLAGFLVIVISLACVQ
jgi:RNA polymerase sigma-70 factor, ECF subfamily